MKSGIPTLAIQVVCEWAEGLGVRLEVESDFPMEFACVVGVCERNLRIELEVEIGFSMVGVCDTMCEVSVYGEIEVRKGVHVWCVVWVIHSALLSVAVEMCEGHWVSDMLLGVVLSCLVGWVVLVGLTWVIFVVHKTKGVA